MSTLLLRDLGLCRRDACEAIGGLKLRTSPGHPPTANDLLRKIDEFLFVKGHEDRTRSLERWAVWGSQKGAPSSSPSLRANSPPPLDQNARSGCEKRIEAPVS